MINKRRFLSDAEMYPEQFMDLPDSGGDGIKNRKRSERLCDTADGKKGDLSDIIGKTAPKWKKNTLKDAVNHRKNTLDTFDTLKKEKKKESARAYAMRVVSGSSVTEKKLYGKLLEKEYTEDEAEDALEYVKSFGYVNDLRLAQGMVEKLAARLWGRFKICYYLKGKGVSVETVEALDFSEIDFPAYCAELIRKYPREKRDAMLRAVKNAGYSGDDYRKAVRLIQEED